MNERERQQLPEALVGHWTNITLHSLNKLDSNLKAMATANSVSFNCSSSQEGSFTSSGVPMRLGARKNIRKLGEFKEEGSLISVKMYDYA